MYYRAAPRCRRGRKFERLNPHPYPIHQAGRNDPPFQQTYVGNAGCEGTEGTPSEVSIPYPHRSGTSASPDSFPQYIGGEKYRLLFG